MVNHVSPRNVYQLREFFDKLNSLRIEFTNEQAPFKKLAVFHFEPNCVQKESFKDTDTRIRIGKQTPIWVSNSSNLVEQSIAVSNADPQYLVASFKAALEVLVFHTEVQLKTVFLEIETAIEIRLDRNFVTLSHRSVRLEKSLSPKKKVFKKTVSAVAFLPITPECRKINLLICKNV